MAPSIPHRYVNNPAGYIPSRLIELQINAQAKRQNYGKSKQMYSGRNKWSKILAKPTTGMGATASYNPCSCYPAGTTYNSQTNMCYYYYYGVPQPQPSCSNFI
jgi:hypothetical protein